jgi:hypothetical protein
VRARRVARGRSGPPLPLPRLRARRAATHEAELVLVRLAQNHGVKGRVGGLDDGRHGLGDVLGQARLLVDEREQLVQAAAAGVVLGLVAARRKPLHRREALDLVLGRQRLLRVGVHGRNDHGIGGGKHARLRGGRGLVARRARARGRQSAPRRRRRPTPPRGAARTSVS